MIVIELGKAALVLRGVISFSVAHRP